MSEVKSKVIAIVTGVPYVPKETVALGEDEVVVKRQTPNDVREDLFAEFAQGGEVPAGIPSFVGERVSSCSAIFAAPYGRQPSNDATGVSVDSALSEEQSAPPEPKKKRFIKFRVFGNGILPNEFTDCATAFPFFEAWRAGKYPQIVLPR